MWIREQSVTTICLIFDNFPRPYRTKAPFRVFPNLKNFHVSYPNNFRRKTTLWMKKWICTTDRCGLKCLTAAANDNRDVSSRRFNALQVLLTCQQLNPFTCHLNTCTYTVYEETTTITFITITNTTAVLKSCRDSGSHRICNYSYLNVCIYTKGRRSSISESPYYIRSVTIVCTSLSSLLDIIIKIHNSVCFYHPQQWTQTHPDSGSTMHIIWVSRV